jgi:uncharacterized protein YbaR (Trm112 family)
MGSNTKVFTKLLSILTLVFFILIHSNNFLFDSFSNSNLSKDSFNASKEDYYNITNAGSDEITIIGEPLHLGDSGVASILIHNSGQYNDTVRLIIEGVGNEILFSGDDIKIMPGSSKELSTIFIPQIVGNMEFLWHVYSPMGGIDPGLNGSFNVEILEPQSLVLSYNSYEWELSSSLKIDLSLYLSNGAPRPILLNIFNELEPEDILYSSKLVMDNGFRLLSVNLGNPDFSNLAIEVIPLSWFNSIENSINTTSLNVIIPFADIDLNIDNYYPKNPSLGENLSFEYTIINNGNSATSPGIVRIIMPDQTIIHEGPLSSLSSGSSYTGTINIESWNYVQLVNTTIIWISDSDSGGDWVFITPSNSGQSDSYGIDFFSLFYGLVFGLSAVLIGKVVIGAVSNRTPSTNPDSDLRPPRKSKNSTTSSNKNKREISCPLCEQRLNVPQNHDGMVKCPSCTSNFDIKDDNSRVEDNIINVQRDNQETQYDIMVVSSNMDMLDCPGCSQKLKVPLGKRPVRARCPACRSEFMATQGVE